MNEVDKLRVLIPHWIEHNEEHAGEFRRWAEEAGDAADFMSRVNQSLAVALDKLGGALPLSHHEHHE